jgi:hypothetical protein
VLLHVQDCLVAEAKRLELCVLLEAPDQMQLQVRQPDAAALAAVYEAFRWPTELWWQVMLGFMACPVLLSKYLACSGVSCMSTVDTTAGPNDCWWQSTNPAGVLVLARLTRCDARCMGSRHERFDVQSCNVFPGRGVQLLASAQFTGYQKARLLQLREAYLRNVAQLAKARAAYEVKTELKTCCVTWLPSPVPVCHIHDDDVALQCCCGKLSAVRCDSSELR